VEEKKIETATKFGKREQQEFCPAKITFWHQPQKNFIEVQKEISKFKGCWRVIIYFFCKVKNSHFLVTSCTTR